MRFSLLIAGASLLAAVPAAAQEHQGNHTDPVTAVQPIQASFTGWMVQVAEELTAAEYGYRPVATVRTMGELLGHVANSNYAICSTIAGENNPNSNDFEKAPRAQVIDGLKAAVAYCGKVATATREKHHDPVSLFGMNGDVTWATALNAAHNAEHYGNIVTYMRMMGKVPPSSR